MKALVSSVALGILMLLLVPAARADQRCVDGVYAAIENPAELRHFGLSAGQARLLAAAREDVVGSLAIATDAQRQLENLELIEPLLRDNGRGSKLFQALRDRLSQRITNAKANASFVTDLVDRAIRATCDEQQGRTASPPPPRPYPRTPPVVLQPRRPPPGSYTLVDGETEVHNTHQKELQIDPGGRKATLRHCCDGGGWDAEYTWEVPATITPGREAKVTIGIDVRNVKPRQELTLGIVVRAPDLAKQLLVKYPSPGSDSATYDIPTSTSTYGGVRDIAVSIDFESSTVTYHYRRN